MAWKGILDSDILFGKITEINKASSDAEIGSNDFTYSLLGGYAGIALFYFQYGKHTALDFSYHNSEKFISNSIISYKNTKKPMSSFCNGLSGMLWGIKYLADLDFITIDKNIQVKQNAALYKFSIYALGKKDFDYLHGGLGICLNALQFPEDQNSRDYLSKVVNVLNNDAIDIDNGLAWQSLDFETKKPIYNLGLSHGVPSIIAVLSLIHEAGIEKNKTRQLLEGSISYLLLQKLPKDKLSIFPYAIPLEKDIDIGHSRLSCKLGDLVSAYK